MRLRLSTAESTWLEKPDIGWVRVVLANGGSIGIRPGHAPLLAETAAGPLLFGRGDEEERVDIDRGILQVHGEGVDILAAPSAPASFGEGLYSSADTRFDRLASALLQLLPADPAAYAAEQGER